MRPQRGEGRAAGPFESPSVAKAMEGKGAQESVIIVLVGRGRQW